MQKTTHFLASRGPAVLLGLCVAGAALAFPRVIREFGILGAAGIAGLTAVLLSVMANPLVPFAMYFGALFFAETTIPGVPVSANQVLALLFLLSFAVHKASGKAMRVESGFLPLLAVAAAYFTLNAVLGEDTARGLTHARYVVIYFLLAWCLAATLGTERAVMALCWIVVALTFVAALAGLYEAAQKSLLSGGLTSFFGQNRIKGTAKNSIVFAWNIVFATPFAFLLYSQLRTGALRVTAMALCLFSLFTALLTFNRQTMLVIPAVLGLSAFLFTYRNRRTLLVLLAAVGTVLALTAMPLLVQRFTSVRGIRTDVSFRERRDNFLIGSQMLREHPAFGVGLGSFPAVWRDYIPPDYPTHTAQYTERARTRFPDFGYMQLLSETGWAGLVLFLAVMGSAVRRAWAVRRGAIARGDPFAHNLAAVVLVLCLFVLATAAVLDNFLYVRTWIMFGLALLMDERVLAAAPEAAPQGEPGTAAA
jgi:O-antigen ligase